MWDDEESAETYTLFDKILVSVSSLYVYVYIPLSSICVRGLEALKGQRFDVLRKPTESRGLVGPETLQKDSVEKLVRQSEQISPWDQS